tara:strand:- start:101 stop:1039 length:939 start_codon:yes stop_codon:yes gene_type:complete
MFSQKQWMTIAAGGVISALLYALVTRGSLGGVLLAYFCQLPLFVIGLSLGTTASVIAGAVAAAGVIAVSGVLGAFVFILVNAAPVVFLVRQGLLSRPDGNGNTEWYPPGLLAVGATLYGLGLLVVAWLWLSVSTGGIEESVRAYLGEVTSTILQGQPAEMQQALIDNVAPILPGTVALSWLVMLVINGVLGQGLVARFERNLRPSPDFAMLELPNWLTVLGAALLIGAILLPGTLGYFAKSAAFILALPFFLVGLSVIHVAARRISAGTLLLVLFYLLMLLFGWPAVFVAFFGLIEQRAGFRQKWAGAGKEE